MSSGVKRRSASWAGSWCGSSTDLGVVSPCGCGQGARSPGGGGGCRGQCGGRGVTGGILVWCARAGVVRMPRLPSGPGDVGVSAVERVSAAESWRGSPRRRVVRVPKVVRWWVGVEVSAVGGVSRAGSWRGFPLGVWSGYRGRPVVGWASRSAGCWLPRLHDLGIVCPCGCGDGAKVCGGRAYGPGRGADRPPHRRSWNRDHAAAGARLRPVSAAGAPPGSCSFRVAGGDLWCDWSVLAARTALRTVWHARLTSASRCALHFPPRPGVRPLPGVPFAGIFAYFRLASYAVSETER